MTFDLFDVAVIVAGVSLLWWLAGWMMLRCMMPDPDYRLQIFWWVTFTFWFVQAIWEDMLGIHDDGGPDGQ